MTDTPNTPRQPLTSNQIKLLQALYTETTMTDVAKTIGYSPRHCRRLVRELLHTMGVTTPRQAVAVAVADGRINPPGKGTSRAQNP